MMFDRKSVACPACSVAIEISRSMFLLDFRCPHCGAGLKVSPLYMRVVVLLGVLLGYTLAWKIGSLSSKSCFFGIPSWFYLLCLPITILILPFVTRIAPFLVRLSLVLRHPFESHLTTMNLASDPKDDHPPDEKA